MTMTMQESAARHMAAGVEDLDELSRLVGSDIGRAPSREALRSYRTRFRRHGEGWIEAEREAKRRWNAENPERVRARGREAKRRRYEEDPERAREANREANRLWRAENPERAREASRLWKAENPAQYLLKQCRGRSVSRGQLCIITVADIEEMLAPMTCSATGLPLSWDHDGDSTRNPWAPSIDRIDCARGYVPGNVRVVCTLYNIARSDFPDEDFLKVAKALAARAP